MPDLPDITQAILEAAAERGALKTTCPSEIARARFPGNWRAHMDDIREAALKLHEGGQITVSQKGIPITSSPVKGPIRIGLKNKR